MPTQMYNLWEMKEFNHLNPHYCIEKLKPWLISQKWKVRTSSNHIKAYQRGVHVNFRTELDIGFRNLGDGIIVELHHYAKLKVPSMIICGILTAGITTIYGAGALAIHIQEGKKFIERLWKEIEIILKCQQASFLGKKTRINSKRKRKNKETNPFCKPQEVVKEEVIVEEHTTTTTTATAEQPNMYMDVNQSMMTHAVPLHAYEYCPQY